MCAVCIYMYIGIHAVFRLTCCYPLGFEYGKFSGLQSSHSEAPQPAVLWSSNRTAECYCCKKEMWTRNMYQEGRKETKGFNCFLCNPAMNSFRAAIKRAHRCNLNILQLPLKYLHFNTLEIKLHSKRSVLRILFSNITGSFICKYITGFCQF